jgi:hypothetical protein
MHAADIIQYDHHRVLRRLPECIRRHTAQFIHAPFSHGAKVNSSIHKNPVWEMPHIQYFTSFLTETKT